MVHDYSPPGSPRQKAVDELPNLNLTTTPKEAASARLNDSFNNRFHPSLRLR